MKKQVFITFFSLLSSVVYGQYATFEQRGLQVSYAIKSLTDSTHTLQVSVTNTSNSNVYILDAKAYTRVAIRHEVLDWWKCLYRSIDYLIIKNYEIAFFH